MERESSDHIMFLKLSEAAQADERLRLLLEAAQEYAAIYLIAAERKKGCDGMGELAMVREEFRESLDRLLGYCAKQGYLYGDIQPDVDQFSLVLGRHGLV